MKLCPCCSGKEYEKCCKPYHLGLPAENALLLMRSRYSAYAMELPDYIIKTTHPMSIHFRKDTKEWKREIVHFCQTTQFEKLEILHFKKGKETAEVLFTAFLKQEGRDATFTERSRFEKVKGVWLYLEGQIFQGALV